MFESRELMKAINTNEDFYKYMDMIGFSPVKWQMGGALLSVTQEYIDEMTYEDLVMAAKRNMNKIIESTLRNPMLAGLLKTSIAVKEKESVIVSILKPAHYDLYIKPKRIGYICDTVECSNIFRNFIFIMNIIIGIRLI